VTPDHPATPEHWGFVVAAYGLAAIVLGGYWRRLVRLEREATAKHDRRPATPGTATPR